MTLIRSVLCSIPIYLFQVVQPPLAVLGKLELILIAFFGVLDLWERNGIGLDGLESVFPFLKGVLDSVD